MPVSAHTMEASNRTLTCPQCGKTKTVCIEPKRMSRPTLRVKCACGAHFAIPFQRRAFSRKHVTLTGDLFPPPTDPTGERTCLGNIHISSLSLGGMSFLPTALSPGEQEPTFAVGDHYIVAFTLDDAGRTPLEMGIRICHTHGQAVGAAFVDDTYSYDIDFYLTP